MSKTSIKSRASSTRIPMRRRRRREEEALKLKPFGFCCSINTFDPLSKYDRRAPPYQSSLSPIESVNESPIVKFQTQFTDLLELEQKRKTSKIKLLSIGDYDAQQDHPGFYSLCQPLQWFLEDEIAASKEIFWSEKQKTYNEELDRNIAIGKEKTMRKTEEMSTNKYPRWYQDFSIDQVKNLMLLERVMCEDYEEMVTGRTQRVLSTIGVISTFFKVAPTDIRKLQKTCDLNGIEFLKEIYKILTGSYFEDEGYKKFYDCNERIILSAIAFLSLPETVIELHKRLPFPVIPKLPPKPLPPICPPRLKMSSPYKEELFKRPDWPSYLNKLQRWRKRCQLIPIPRIILPSSCNLPKSISNVKNTDEDKRNMSHLANETPVIKKNVASKVERSTDIVRASERTKKEYTAQTGEQREVHNKEEPPIVFDIPRLPDENQVFDFTINGLSEKKTGPVEYKICGTLKPPKPNQKSWLGEKDAHYIISGANDEPPSCPVTYEMTGIANVTPTNSDERFFAVLKLGDGPKQIYPSGRKNLSKNWQEWLQNADEEFRKVEREANRMIKSIEATMRLVFPGPTCDSCCSCRQTRKSHIKARETKSPYLVIDTIAEDGDRNK